MRAYYAVRDDAPISNAYDPSAAINLLYSRAELSTLERREADDAESAVEVAAVEAVPSDSAAPGGAAAPRGATVPGDATAPGDTTAPGENAALGDAVAPQQAMVRNVLLDLLRNESELILLSVYSLRNVADSNGSLVEALCAASRRGVAVRCC